MEMICSENPNADLTEGGCRAFPNDMSASGPDARSPASGFTNWRDMSIDTSPAVAGTVQLVDVYMQVTSEKPDICGKGGTIRGLDFRKFAELMNAHAYLPCWDSRGSISCKSTFKNVTAKSFYNDLEARESLMGPKPEAVPPVVLKLFRTGEISESADPRTIYDCYATAKKAKWYIVEVTEVHDTPGQETVTASDRGATQSYGTPADIGETSSTPGRGLAIDPLFAAEQNHFIPYLESQLDATDERNWFYPPHSQQTDDFTSYLV